MSIHENTISNTRLMSIIVILSVIALSYVLNGGNRIDNKQTRVIDDSADNSATNNTKTLFQKRPVPGEKVRFHDNPYALVLTI